MSKWSVSICDVRQLNLKVGGQTGLFPISVTSWVKATATAQFFGGTGLLLGLAAALGGLGQGPLCSRGQELFSLAGAAKRGVLFW